MNFAERFSVIFLALGFLFLYSGGTAFALTCGVGGGCGAGETALLKMSATDNAHAGFVGSSAYPNQICCSETGVVIDINCAGSHDIFLKLSSADNAHVEKSNEANYSGNACISVDAGVIDCDYADDCSTLGANYVCLAEISADTNAHIGNCGSAYTTKICCGYEPDCGDGFVTGDEVCDTAGDIDCPIETPKCKADCSGCEAVCGDDQLGGDEECEKHTDCPGATPVCNNCVCEAELCGNGFLDPGEACDKLNNMGCSGVNSLCSDDCSFCTCALDSNLIWAGNFSGKRQPIICIILNLISWILRIIGTIALLTLILGGIYYAVSGSNPDGQTKAKKMVTYAIIGLVIILIPYTIILNMHNILVEESISIRNASVAPLSGPVGTDFIITATITAPAGVNPATTIAHIQNPDELDIATVTLVDNGAGVYTGAWTSAALGSYFVDIDACDVDGNCAEAENI